MVPDKPGGFFVRQNKIVLTGSLFLYTKSKKEGITLLFLR